MKSFFGNIDNYPADFSCAELLNIPIDNSVSEMINNTNGHSAQFTSMYKYPTCIDPEGKLKELLTEWKLEMVYQTCLGN